MTKIQTQGVHHITLVGSNRQTSIDFWEGVLGMPFVFEQPNLDKGSESHLYFDPGDGRLITVFTSEPGVIAEELQTVGFMCRHEHLQEQPPEQRRENLHGQEIARSARDPFRSIPRQAATGHDHVDMRVVGERGAPGVQHRHEADASAQMPACGRDLERGLRRRLEQQIVDHRLVGVGDVGDRRRQRVDNMEVRNGK